MEIKPIRNETDYEQALRRIEALWGAAQGTFKGNQLDVLATLVEAYERERYPVDFPNPLDAIEFRLEQEGKDYRALIGVIGERTRVYEVMRGDRPLSLAMIRNLHQKLGIPAEILIQPAGKKMKKKVHRRVGVNRTRKSGTLPRSA